MLTLPPFCKTFANAMLATVSVVWRLCKRALTHKLLIPLGFLYKKSLPGYSSGLNRRRARPHPAERITRIPAAHLPPEGFFPLLMGR